MRPEKRVALSRRLGRVRIPQLEGLRWGFRGGRETRGRHICKLMADSCCMAGNQHNIV